MHVKSVLKSLGLLLLLITIVMLVSLSIAYYDVQNSPNPINKAAFKGFLGAIGWGGALSFTFLFLSRGALGKIEIREALLLVTSAWLFGGIVAAFPFYFYALYLPAPLRHHYEFYSFINCLFEAVSGLTATGASILVDIERLPRAVLFWRTNIPWLGGLGIVVLFVAILPFLAGGQTKIYKAEATGIGDDTGTANIREMARGLWMIYVFFTILQMGLLKIGDQQLDWFAVTTIAFSSTSTAGFSIFSQSAGSLTTFNQWVCICFMFLGGVNFALYFGLLKGKVRGFLENSEFKAYFYIMVISIILITINIYGEQYFDMKGDLVPEGVFAAFTDATFQVTSIQSTTGFSSVDSNGFPVFSKMLLVILMFVGGCGGSTSGGIKVIRILSACRLLLTEVEKVFRPNIVRPVVVGGKILDPTVRQRVLAYVLLVLLSCMIASLVLGILEPEVDPFSLVCTAIAILNNVGPGFGLVGVTQNYNFFSDSSKIFLTSLMIVGRLEFLTVLALLMPRFWRR